MQAAGRQGCASLRGAAASPSLPAALLMATGMATHGHAPPGKAHHWGPTARVRRDFVSAERRVCKQWRLARVPWACAGGVPDKRGYSTALQLQPVRPAPGGKPRRGGSLAGYQLLPVDVTCGTNKASCCCCPGSGVRRTFRSEPSSLGLFCAKKKPSWIWGRCALLR